MISAESHKSYHGSFRHLYDLRAAGDLPFNASPNAAANGEAPKFSALPTKRNFAAARPAAPTAATATAAAVEKVAAGVGSAAAGAAAGLWRAVSAAVARRAAAAGAGEGVEAAAAAAAGAVGGGGGRRSSGGGGGVGASSPSGGGGGGAAAAAPAAAGAAHLDFERALLPVILSAVACGGGGGGGRDGGPATEAAVAALGEPDMARQRGARAVKAAPSAVPLAAAAAAAEAAMAAGAVRTASMADAIQLRDLSEAGARLSFYGGGGGGDAEDIGDSAAAGAVTREAMLTFASSVFLPSPTQWTHLDELRVHAGAPERSEMGIEKLLRYFAQLLHMEEKFAFQTKKVQIEFFWFEAFAADRKVIATCIQYEKAAVLYNVAAVLCQLGCAQRLWTKDGKRNASIYFQKAAGVLLFVRDTLCQRFQLKLDTASDLSEKTLTAAAQLMLAQAMECYLDKAYEDGARSTVISMISAQTADFFEIALTHAKDDLPLIGRSRFSKEWTAKIAAKYHLYVGLAHFHAPLLLAPEQALGERVARLYLAKTHCLTASKLGKDVPGPLQQIIKGHTEMISSAHLLADAANFEKHNHSSIDPQLVATLKRPPESLVAPVPFETVSGPLARFPDMFAAIAPAAPSGGGSARMWGDGGGGSVEVMESLAEHLVDAARQELAACGTEIESTLRALSADEVASGGGVSGLSIDQLVKANQRAGAALVEKMDIVRAEEIALQSKVLMDALESFHAATASNLNEAESSIRSATLESEMLPKAEELQKALSDLRAEVEPHREALSTLHNVFKSEMEDFDPLEWTREKLLDLIPTNLIGSSQGAEIEMLRLQDEDQRRRKRELLDSLDALKSVCKVKVDEMKRLEEDILAQRQLGSMAVQRSSLSRYTLDKIKESVLRECFRLRGLSLQHLASTASLKANAEKDPETSADASDPPIDPLASLADNKIEQLVATESSAPYVSNPQAFVDLIRQHRDRFSKAVQASSPVQVITTGRQDAPLSEQKSLNDTAYSRLLALSAGSSATLSSPESVLRALAESPQKEAVRLAAQCQLNAPQTRRDELGRFGWLAWRLMARASRSFDANIGTSTEAINIGRPSVSSAEEGLGSTIKALEEKYETLLKAHEALKSQTGLELGSSAPKQSQPSNDPSANEKTTADVSLGNSAALANESVMPLNPRRPAGMPVRFVGIRESSSLGNEPNSERVPPITQSAIPWNLSTTPDKIKAGLLKFVKKSYDLLPTSIVPAAPALSAPSGVYSNPAVNPFGQAPASRKPSNGIEMQSAGNSFSGAPARRQVSGNGGFLGVPKAGAGPQSRKVSTASGMEGEWFDAVDGAENEQLSSQTNGAFVNETFAADEDDTDNSDEDANGYEGAEPQQNQYGGPLREHVQRRRSAQEIIHFADAEAVLARRHESRLSREDQPSRRRRVSYDEPFARLETTSVSPIRDVRFAAGTTTIQDPPRKSELSAWVEEQNLRAAVGRSADDRHAMMLQRPPRVDDSRPGDEAFRRSGQAKEKVSSPPARTSSTEVRPPPLSSEQHKAAQKQHQPPEPTRRDSRTSPVRKPVEKVFRNVDVIVTGSADDYGGVRKPVERRTSSVVKAGDVRQDSGLGGSAGSDEGGQDKGRILPGFFTEKGEIWGDGRARQCFVSFSLRLSTNSHVFGSAVQRCDSQTSNGSSGSRLSQSQRRKGAGGSGGGRRSGAQRKLALSGVVASLKMDNDALVERFAS
ncbi:BRO1-like domain-containing protein [Zopfochytrium polystomum]|nr:BRO1-like domain-containing protein [Zopfochytrium polystomum]